MVPGSFLHWLVVMGIIIFTRKADSIYDLIDDASGMTAERIQKANLKGKAKKMFKSYIDRKTQERGGHA